MTAFNGVLVVVDNTQHGREQNAEQPRHVDREVFCGNRGSNSNGGITIIRHEVWLIVQSIYFIYLCYQEEMICFRSTRPISQY